MRLVLLGAPGSGKGTQAQFLRDALHIPHISTGELLRGEVTAGSTLGREAAAIMERGELVSDAIVLGMLENRLRQSDAASGFVLDGFPRNLAQARALDLLLDRLGQPVDLAVQLEVPSALLVDRIAGRAELEGRADDTPEAVQRRLEVYLEQTAPVIAYYEGLNRLERVDGVGSMDEVLAAVLAACQRPRC